MEAIGYVRVSTEDQAKHGLSLAAQEARIISWATANDATLLGIHHDDGISGYRLANRPGLQAAIDEACQARAALVVYSLSRMARNTREALEISDRLAHCGADLVSLSEKIDSTSAAGKMIFRLLAVLSEFERDLVSERTKSAMTHARAQGRCVGNVPYGYDKRDGRLVENASELEVIGFLQRLRSRGLSLREIVRELDDRGIRSKNRAKWHPKVINDILRSAERWAKTTDSTS